MLNAASLKRPKTQKNCNESELTEIFQSQLKSADSIEMAVLNFLANDDDYNSKMQ